MLKQCDRCLATSEYLLWEWCPECLLRAKTAYIEAAAPLPDTTPEPVAVEPPQDGKICKRCFRPVEESCPTWWSAPDDLWRQIYGSTAGVRCIPCFTKDCKERGVTVYWQALEEDDIAAATLRPSDEAGEQSARDRAQELVIESSHAVGYADSTWLQSDFKHDLTDRITRELMARLGGDSE